VDANNCIASDSVEVQSQDLDICLEIPSVFTPNEDGRNDLFEIKNIGLFTGVKMEIYNRWNDLLYKSDNYEISSNWWDGKWNGKPMPTGSYAFILILPDREPIQGLISIVR
jgi:gliding motility-associated-like protein